MRTPHPKVTDRRTLATGTVWLTPRMTKEPHDHRHNFASALIRSGASVSERLSGLDVVIQVELPRVRPQPDLVDLPQALVGQPGLDEVGGEDAAGHEVVVVRLKRG